MDGTQNKWTTCVHEVEYFQHEGDLLKKKADCQKNPAHLDFIPAPDFTVEHLPEGHPNSLEWDFIQTVISLTVRLVVRCTSTARPDDYVDAALRGSRCGRTGSAMVWGVYRNFTEENGETCPCTECLQKSPDERKRKWGGFVVVTALHIVYDDEECHESVCDVGFDRDEDRDKCSKLYGVRLRDSDIKRDWCRMYCVTHDELLYNKMAEMASRFYDLLGKLGDHYRRSTGVTTMSKLPVVCVSHPHGLAKHVTVGVVKEVEEDYPCKWGYTTSTCGGSSGAPVFTLGRWDGWDKLWYSRLSTHSGCDQAGVNQCGHSGWWMWY